MICWWVRLWLCHLWSMFSRALGFFFGNFAFLIGWAGLSVFRYWKSKTGWWQLKYFLFSPLPGEMIQFDEHIFQMGWFNHQLEKLVRTVWGGNAEAWSFESVTFLEAPPLCPRPGHKDSHLGNPRSDGWDVDMTWSCFGWFCTLNFSKTTSHHVGDSCHKTSPEP